MTVRAAAIGLIVVIVGSVASFTVGPGAGAPTGGCATTQRSPIESPSAARDVPQVAWTAAELPEDLDAGGDQILLDVAAFGTGFVAVGRDSNGPDPNAFVLHSADGLAWERIAGDDNRFAGVELRSLVVVGDRLFAVGSATTDDRGGSRVAIWLTEDGRTWREAAGPFDDAYHSSLVGDESGLLMVGPDAGGGGPMAWRSTDGLTWQAAPLDLPVPASAALFEALAVTDEGWMAAGSISNGADAPAAPVVWRSTDGTSWSCHLLDDGGYRQAHAWQLYRSGERWLVVGGASRGCGFGASCVGYPVAWASPNGRTWSEAILETEPIGLGGFAFGGGGIGFVGVRSGSTWLSEDGREWTRASDGGTSGAIGGSADALGVDDEGRLVVAGTAHDRSSVLGVWIAVGELRVGDD